MIFGVKRLDDYGETAIRVINPQTGDALSILYSPGEWRCIRRTHLPQNYKDGGREGIIDYIIAQKYIPLDIAGDEFTTLHGQTAHGPILREDNFNLASIPTLRAIVEETQLEWVARIAKLMHPRGE